MEKRKLSRFEGSPAYQLSWASHLFKHFLTKRGEPFTRETKRFYGVRKQGTTKRYFSFWIWIWPLGIQLQEGSPTFDKVSKLEWLRWKLKERKFTFEATFSLPARLKVPNQSMHERCLGPSSHLQVLFSQANWSFFLFFFFALINAR